MPSALRIPPRYLPGIRALSRLTPDGANAIAVALGEVPAHLTRERLASQVAGAAPEIAEDAENLVDALLSLASLLPEGDPDFETFAAVIAESPDLELDGDAQAVFAGRVSQLIALDSILWSARAIDLVTEHERGFHGGRALTDVRPVFRADPSDGPAAATIIATLKIEFHEADGPLNAAYYAMDRADLLALRGVLDRAIAKTEALQELLARAGIPYWEYSEPSDAASS